MVRAVMASEAPTEDPIARFHAIFTRAAANAPFDPTACVLATADAEGRPSARYVLLKQVDDRGFVVFTNYESRKGRQIEDNPRAALCFYWPWLGEQVRVEGTVTRTTAAESDAYFSTRPRGSQIGAWASRQSTPIESREALEAALVEVEQRFQGQDVPRPERWGGYRIVPERIELWMQGDYRVHDRWLYLREGDRWMIQRLQP